MNIGGWQVTEPEAKPAPRKGGRWVKGQSGNPAGRKPGTLNRATRLRALIGETEEKEVLRAVIEHALAGDAACTRLLWSRLAPRRRT